MGGLGSGRKRKPLAEHIRQGTFRNNEHKNRVGAESAIKSGELEMPAGLTPAGKKLWRDYVRWFPSVLLKPSDSLVLADLCRLHPIWVRLSKSKDDGDIDMALKVWAKVNNCYAKLGLSPVDRAKLEVPQSPPESSDPLEQLKLIGAKQA